MMASVVFGLNLKFNLVINNNKDRRNCALLPFRLFVVGCTCAVLLWTEKMGRDMCK